MEKVNSNFIRLSDFVRFCSENKSSIHLSNTNSASDSIESFKKGRKIKIKKENRGLFTKYCGGNVTDKCIQKGKNSSDPKIRKRATFAENSRKWSN